MIDYLEKLTSFHSVTDDQIRVRALLDYVSVHLQAYGLSVEILTYEGVHDLYASTTSKKHSRILLQGHADIVPGNQPFHQDNLACYGRGTFDMLFGIAAFMRLVDEIDVSSSDIAIMLSGDEEKGGFHGVNRMLSDGYTSDICLLPDAGEGFGSLNIAAKGVYSLLIEIHGKTHHASRPWEGDGAGVKLLHFLYKLEALFDSSSRDNSTMTISKLQAGVAMNQGPAAAIAGVDIRYKNKTDLARIKKGMQILLKEHDGKIIETTNGSDYQLPLDNPLVQQFLKIYQSHLDQPIRYTKAHGSSDARFFSEKDIPVIMFRPDGGGAHGDHEWISRDSLEKFYQVLKEYVTLVATEV